MTDTQLTTLSTLCWLVGTVSLFILVAHWSMGESWGLTASIVGGVRGWSDRDAPHGPVISPYIDVLTPYPALGRPVGGVAAARLPATEQQPTAKALPIVEIIELGERRLPPRATSKDRH